MSEVKQTTVNPAAPSDKPLGARNERNLQKSFSASPIYNGELDDDERRLTYQELAMDGNVQNGLGLSSFNRDFIGTERDPVPDLNDVKTGGSGLPASPFVPNPTSPGPGSVFPIGLRTRKGVRCCGDCQPITPVTRFDSYRHGSLIKER